jgi:C-terminal processing protease CtpA/Prc
MTRLFGFVRFFNPVAGSEELNWSALAVDGARAAEPATDADDLAQRLESWIRQVAPTVRVRAAEVHAIASAIAQGDAELIDPSLQRPDGAEPATIVSWLHHGINLTERPNVYRSTRERLEIAANAEAMPAMNPAQPMVLDLGGGLCAVVPRCVYETDDAVGALPFADVDNSKFAVDDRAVRFANIAIAWTVIQHFYPYFDVVGTDWDAALASSLRAAAPKATATEFHHVLRRMIAQLQDGHGGVYYQNHGDFFMPAIVIDEVEGQWIVTHAPADAATPLKAGDEIISVDGEPIADVVARHQAMICSATPGWTRWRLAQEILTGPKDSELTLAVDNPADGARTVTLRRTDYAQQVSEPRPETVAELEPGIWYFDTSRATNDDFHASVDAMAQAKGVIFDMRGYPSNLSPIVISHLTDKPVTCAQWHVPKVTRPNREGMEFQFSNWPVQPMPPRITGKVVFITDGRAISYAETYMGIIEHARLGEIVGEPTAGTNGNVTTVALLGGYFVPFTGMKVLKHDGSPHHGVGIIPTVPCSRTIDGVRAGKDELLERAIEVVKQQG